MANQSFNEQPSTKQLLLQMATSLFAERGYYGVSIADIANTIGVTKQSLLYHFGSKEKLYEAVIENISEQTVGGLEAYFEEEQPDLEQLEEFFLAQLHMTLSHPESSRVILRELMDNKQRADSVKAWILNPYLDSIVAFIGRVPEASHMSWEERFALAYQIQGAIMYFMISAPTLENMFGATRFKKLKKAFQPILRQHLQTFFAAQDQGV
jgi:AcrR family transcriptional regulator